MKTPHSIELIYGDGKREYDPILDEYIEGASESVKVPCLANFVSQERVFELYGDRIDRVLIVRFSQEQKPFKRAKFDDRTFVPIEAIDAPIKGAVRLREVANE